MMLTRFLRRFAPAIALAGAMMAAPSGGALAQSGATLLDTFNDWGAYTASADGAKVCYALSQPERRLPEELRRGAAYLFARSARQSRTVRNEWPVVRALPTPDGQDAIAECDR